MKIASVLPLNSTCKFLIVLVDLLSSRRCQLILALVAHGIHKLQSNGSIRQVLMNSSQRT